MKLIEVQYYPHLCACGCGEYIEIKKSHKKDGIPIYIHNHHTKGKKLNTRSKEHCEKISKAAKERLKNKENHPFYGKKLTEEHRNNISKGRIEKESAKGENNPMYGKNHTEETIEKIKLNMPDFSGKKNPNYGNGERLKGNKNPNWNNGSSFEPYSPEFNKEKKQQVLERDNYTCQCPDCEGDNKRLSIHHIDYDKMNNNYNNLIVLCCFCHTKTNGKNDRQYWTEFYKNIMRNKNVF